MGSPAPLPMSEILSYCDYYELDGAEFRRTFLKYIRAMDNAQLVIMQKQSDSSAKSA